MEPTEYQDLVDAVEAYKPDEYSYSDGHERELRLAIITAAQAFVAAQRKKEVVE